MTNQTETTVLEYFMGKIEDYRNEIESEARRIITRLARDYSVYITKNDLVNMANKLLREMGVNPNDLIDNELNDIMVVLLGLLDNELNNNGFITIDLINPSIRGQPIEDFEAYWLDPERLKCYANAINDANNDEILTLYVRMPIWGGLYSEWLSKHECR
jgi:hypothetical protein